MKKILFPVMMLAALASCSKNDNSADINNSVPEIKLSGKALSVETKGAFNGTTPSVAAPLDAYVVGSKVTGNYSVLNQHVAGVMTFTDKAVGFDNVLNGSKQYPVAKAPVYMIGLHPGTGWTNDGLGNATLVMDGTQDVMIAPQITTTSADVEVSGTIKNFEFNHKLTQIEVMVIVDGDQTVSDAWGVLKAMSLPGQFNSTATVAMGATSTIAFSVPVANWSLYTAADAAYTGQSLVLPITGRGAGTSNDGELMKNAVLAGYTIFPPITVTAGVKAFDLAITTGAAGNTTNDVMTTVPVVLKNVGGVDFANSTEGYKFTILLSFKAKTIHATATVKAWTEGGLTVSQIE